MKNRYFFSFCIETKRYVSAVYITSLYHSLNSIGWNPKWSIIHKMACKLSSSNTPDDAAVTATKLCWVCLLLWSSFEKFTGSLTADFKMPFLISTGLQYRWDMTRRIRHKSSHRWSGAALFIFLLLLYKPARARDGGRGEEKLTEI